MKIGTEPLCGYWFQITIFWNNLNNLELLIVQQNAQIHKNVYTQEWFLDYPKKIR